jgi:hypothetical protein
MRFNSSNIHQAPTAVGATDFLRRDDRMASLLPAVERMASLQKTARRPCRPCSSIAKSSPSSRMC